MEPTVSIRCRQADLEMVENVLPEAMSLYNDAMKKPCQITVLKDNFLPANAYAFFPIQFLLFSFFFGFCSNIFFSSSSDVEELN